MKILVLNSKNTYNYGNFLMAINFIYYFHKNHPEIIFEIEVDTDNDFKRIKKELIKDINIVKIEKNQPKNIIIKVLYKIKEILIEPSLINKQKYDAIVMLGGDDLSKYYSFGIGAIFTLLRINSLSKKNKVFLIGQTIGPFWNWQKGLARHCLKDTIIYLRDPFCVKHMEELMLKNFNVSSDLAFLDLPFLKEKYFLNYKLEKEKYIVIIPSGLVKSYTHSQEEYIDCWVKIIKNILKRKQSAFSKIVLLAHVLRPEKVSDKKIIEEIYNRLSLKERDRICKITKELLPSEVRDILGNSFFSISGRMHGAVSTFQKGKPSIVLSYSIKYKGVIGECLKRQDLIIEAKDNNLWKTTEIEKLISKKTNYLLLNYEKIKEEIEKQVDILKDKAVWQIQETINKI